MHHESVMGNAREMAELAWNNVRLAKERDEYESRHQFDPEAFEAALRAYMTVLANQVTRPAPTPQVQKAIDVDPVERTPGEHFLSMCSGHYEGYTLTSGMLPDRVVRKMICFQPDPKSSVLYPLFISLLKAEQEHVLDPQGRPFLVAISGGDALTVVG